MMVVDSNKLITNPGQSHVHVCMYSGTFLISSLKNKDITLSEVQKVALMYKTDSEMKTPP